LTVDRREGDMMNEGLVDGLIVEWWLGIAKGIKLKANG
jgi:hypothetical protein